MLPSVRQINKERTNVGLGVAAGNRTFGKLVNLDWVPWNGYVMPVSVVVSGGERRRHGFINATEPRAARCEPQTRRAGERGVLNIQTRDLAPNRTTGEQTT